MREAAELTVVKLGGSYAFSPELPVWLEALAACAGRVVVVPGGGPFADAVRDAQAKMGFGEAAAHRMALMAMEQFGCAVASLGAGFVLAPSAGAIGHAVRARQVPVWSPLPMALEAADLPASWDVTADSLAAWLAARLQTRRVVFVKQIVPPTSSLDVLMAQGVVDRFLPHLLSERAVEAYIVGPGDHATTAAAILSGRRVGRRLGARPHG
jgi:5-(aminomethyl)-3-furanmethanol phosphate kinase